jgi:hypothetical protein
LVHLSTDLSDPDAIPYFLWDDPMTVAEVLRRLATSSEPERVRLLGKILREARDTDVWAFTSPLEIVRQWPQLKPHLGRRRPFWEFLIGRWRALGRVYQLVPDKPVVDGVRVDPPEEILANKLCALLSRAEVRDLVDVYMLERTGLRAEDALDAAMRKDGGATAAQLAWVLSQITIGEDVGCRARFRRQN